jgi:hypothetical protein
MQAPPPNLDRRRRQEGKAALPKCPGQDKYFWKPDDIFDAPCPACGEPVEFFKTDPARKCPGCGHGFANPRLDPGCAQWCPHAELCVGVRLSGRPGAAADEGGTVRLVDRLVAAVRRRTGVSRGHIVHTLGVLQQAQELLVREGGDPRVVLPTVVLDDLARQGETLDAAAILSEAGFDGETIERVQQMLGEAGEGDAASLEAAVAGDSRRLVELAEGHLAAPSDPDEDAAVERLFTTESARQQARELLRGQAAATG